MINRRKAGLHFARQRALPVRYKEVQLDCGYKSERVSVLGIFFMVFQEYSRK